MNSLMQASQSASNAMIASGLALDTLTDLMGADGLDHGFSSDQLDGLVHAVKAIGMLMHQCGLDLAVETDPSNPVLAGGE